MARPTTTHVLEIESGIGEPAFIPLTLGQELQPISVGKKGMWRIESPRVLDVHAFVYFDGSALFVQSADEGSAAMADGYRIGKTWTELRAPCRIEIGQAKLRFRSLVADAGEDRTLAMDAPPAGTPLPTPAPLPAPSPSAARGLPVKPERPFRPGEFSSAIDDESTRVAPVEQTNLGRRPRLDDDGSRAVRPAAGMPPAGMGASGAYPMPLPAAGVPAAMGSSPGGSMPPGPMHHHGMQPGSMPPPMHPSMPPGMVPTAVPSTPVMPGQPGAGHPSYGPPPYPPAAGSGYPPNAFPQGVMPYGPGGMPNGSVPPPGAFPSTTLQPATAPAQKASGFGAKWNEMPVVRRLLILLSPVFLVSAYYMLMVEDPPPPPRKKPVAALDAGVVTASTVPSAASQVVTAGSATASDAGPAPSAAPASSGSAATSASVPPPVAATTPTRPPAGSRPDAAPPLAPGQKTLERQAIDAYALGDYARAVATYDKLAAMYPNNVVYVEAARIIRAKMDGGVP